MTRTYFYSERQKKRIFEMQRMQGRIERINYIDGKPYTEIQSSDGEHISNFDDAIIVKEVHGLPVDEFMLKHIGKRFAL